jgi:hypothetical protein
MKLLNYKFECTLAPHNYHLEWTRCHFLGLVKHSLFWTRRSSPDKCGWIPVNSYYKQTSLNCHCSGVGHSQLPGQWPSDLIPVIVGDSPPTSSSRPVGQVLCSSNLGLNSCHKYCKLLVSLEHFLEKNYSLNFRFVSPCIIVQFK